MLLDVHGNRVNRDPHREQFDAWCHGISNENFQAMEDAINDFCDRNDEFRSSFMPGQDETIGRLFPTLTAACNGNEQDAGLFFGNIVWRILDDKPEEWRFARSEQDEENPLGMFYWRRNS